MSQSEDEVARIARGLTKAQRAAVLWCDDGWKDRDKACPRAVSFYVLREVRRGNPRAKVATVFSLVDVEFARPAGREWTTERYSLTPLGTAVRRYLEIA